MKLDGVAAKAATQADTYKTWANLIVVLALVGAAIAAYALADGALARVMTFVSVAVAGVIPAFAVHGVSAVLRVQQQTAQSLHEQVGVLQRQG